METYSLVGVKVMVAWNFLGNGHLDLGLDFVPPGTLFFRQVIVPSVLVTHFTEKCCPRHQDS